MLVNGEGHYAEDHYEQGRAFIMYCLYCNFIVLLNAIMTFDLNHLQNCYVWSTKSQIKERRQQLESACMRQIEDNQHNFQLFLKGIILESLICSCVDAWKSCQFICNLQIQFKLEF